METRNPIVQPFLVLLTVSILAGALPMATHSIKAHQQSNSASRAVDTEHGLSSETIDTAPNELVGGQEIAGVVSIQALVEEDHIMQVDFMLAGPRGIFRSEYNAPYFFFGSHANKPVGWDTTQYPDGDYTLNITAWSAHGKTHTSEVTFHIANQQTPSTIPNQDPMTTMYIPLTQEPTPSQHQTNISADAIMLPGRIEAEDYREGGNGVGYYDTTPGNMGNSYRNGHVDIQSCGEKQGCYNIGWMDAGEWLAYDVTFATSGEYTFVARAAALGDGRKFHILLDERDIAGSMDIMNTDGRTFWIDVYSDPVLIEAGTYTLQIVADTDSFDLDYVDVVATAAPTNQATQATTMDTPTEANTVMIMVDYSTPIGTSQMKLGATHTRHTLNVADGQPEAVMQARSILASVAQYQNQHIMGWGALNPNPAPGEYDWSSLDARINIIREMGAEPVITLCCAPDWMKGGKAGTTDWDKLTWAPFPTHYDDFAQLSAEVAQRYPDVKYFQVWNEMKGFWSKENQNWDYFAYTKLYNKVYDAVKEVRPDAQIGGLYMVIEGTGSHKGGWPTETPIRARQWEVINHWVEHQHGADFIILDRGLIDNHDDHPYTVDEQMQLTPMFGKVIQQIRTRTDLPIWWGEWYTGGEGQVAATIATSVLYHMLVNGSSMALLWNPMEVGESGHALFADVRDTNGGQPTDFYKSFRFMARHFGPGTELYATTSSSPDVEVLASPDKTVIINKRNNPVVVNVNGLRLDISAYDMRMIDTP
ncbi:MAG: hypothetical protein GFH27_549379n8 [Chloroflexi bacterium AL-W]|nr:hypothetical protein [Chloroflexi bacterium AL-N1]NOK71132.1 hypothetical protein [Chloroflexi bacterium AL-N10]NOK78598.1 hypothetical protein [Chloroflexi bacterium AL-N5]NOK85894.1 hypothetical protein [Chloroflexi bacterium AL-W]NOK92869.1 hypothetical protein [Chloroflexi bacterium AL-N15]